jgi:hypothetical protein
MHLKFLPQSRYKETSESTWHYRSAACAQAGSLAPFNYDE